MAAQRRRGPPRPTGYDAGHDLKNDGNGVFIDSDPDRFFVHVADPSANQNDGVRETIQATLGTFGAVGGLDDDPTPLELLETEPDSGHFRFEALLLMSLDLPLQDNPDNDVQVWSERAGGLVGDDALNDRTHRATIDGSVMALYTPNQGDPITAEVPVTQRDPDARRVLRMRARIHLEPYNDVGVQRTVVGPEPDGPIVGLRAENGVLIDKVYDFDPDAAKTGEADGWFTFVDSNSNGIHDPGEISEPYWDMSHFHDSSPENNFARGDHFTNQGGDGWGQITKPAFVAEQLERAQIAWAQAGIAVNLVGPPTVERAAADPDDADKTVIHDGWFDVTPTVNSLDVIPEVQRIGGAASFDVVEVIFTTALRAPQDPDDPKINGATSRPGNHSDGGFPAEFAENSYVLIGTMRTDVGGSTALDIRNRTVAHELGHALTNRPDDSELDMIPYIFFPSAESPLDNTPEQRRRIRHDTENDARTERAPGDLTAIGNRLLQPIE